MADPMLQPEANSLPSLGLDFILAEDLPSVAFG